MAISEEMVTTCFEIVAAVGSAKSCYINAVNLAKQGDFDGAGKSIAEGDAAYKEGHEHHMAILQKDAADQDTEFSLILMHAEDQMMAAETFRVMAEDFIEVYKRLDASA